LWAADTLTAAAPAPLVVGTVRAALPFAAGHAVASPHVLTLSTGVLRAMFLNKLKAAAAAVLAVAVILGAGGLAWHALAEPAKAEKPKEDKDAIVGHWKIEKVEEDGMDASETGEGKKLTGATLDITADKIVLPDVGEIAYKLDPTAKPKAIDLDNGAKTFDCVYTLDGDTLTICAPIMPGGPRPTEVASKAGSGTRVVVMKREGE
ncbi:MAG: TIGR03067 domain-containing protein, partial [Zavarzinella sp.]|nr:TIGR03067 domain-containing protein [Zavarzinella sp.]